MLALLMMLAGRAAAEPHRLVENFTAALPSSGEVLCSVDYENAKVGLACGRITYKVHPQHRRAWLDFPQEHTRIPGPGRLELWVKGDGSGNELQLCLRHAEVFHDANNNRRLRGHRDLWLPKLKLDFTEWRLVRFDARDVPDGRSLWWQRIVVHAPRGDKAKLEGELLLDELLLIPAKGRPSGAVSIGLLGPRTREFTKDVSLFLDARNFTRNAAKVRARVIVTDRNENLVLDRDFPFELAVNEESELKLDLKPEKLDAYLPPFTIDCDVVSDVPALTAHTSLKMVMGNVRTLFDDMGDVQGRWFTAGIAGERRGWVGWVMGEGQRYSPILQRTARIARILAPKAADPKAQPPGRCAMKVDFTGEAFVYRSRRRYMIGNPYRLGVWVKGDGSGAQLNAFVLDYTDNADFWAGGWRRIRHGTLRLCKLDFTDWRYVEVALPGDGLGSNTMRGSTNALDFPLELTCFWIQPTKEKPSGSVALGPVYLLTQAPMAESISVQLGYDDPDRLFAPKHNAHVTVQNGSLAGARHVEVNWTLLDRLNDEIARGKFEVNLASGAMQTVRVKLSEHAKAIAPRLAPLRLQVVAADVEDVTVSTRRELILAKPDSTALISDFEADRGYLGLKPRAARQPPPPGHAAAYTSTAQAHSGKRSVALKWDREEHNQLFVSVDPMVPGVPTEVSLWVLGDESGVVFYPLIGDRYGVSHGAPQGQWDLFLPRTGVGPLQNAVRVDWRGWKQLTFRLPIIPPTWHEELPVIGFESSYPMGIHLALDASDAAAAKGTLYVDDVVARTHLPPEERMSIEMRRWSSSNVLMPGGQVDVIVSNRDAKVGRKAKVSGGVFDWRGRRLDGIDVDVTLKPGERKFLTVARGLKTGAYAVRVDLVEGDKTVAGVREDLLVADLKPVLGKDWATALEDEWRLRAPTGDCFTLVTEDWDWVEYYPGNVQVDTIRSRAAEVKGLGGCPNILLGYSAYWAAGTALEQVESGAFVRGMRDAGHAVYVFMVPERMADWDHYTCEVMRGAGKQVAGWVMWNDPGGSGPLAVAPEQFVEMLKVADKWRRVYCPETPLLIGGMTPETAVPYLQELGKHEGLKHLTGVNVRLDVGRLSPEDAQTLAYVRTLQRALNAGAEKKRTVLLTDLDWAVEKGEEGLGAFDQAAYLARSDLLMSLLGIQPAIAIRNEDYERLGLGLTYRREVTIPPMTERPVAFQFKPSWWAVVRTRQLLSRLADPREVEVQDVVPGRTVCVVYRRKQGGGPLAVVWRVNDPGAVSFVQTGMQVQAAEDVFGSAVPAEKGWHAVGKVPVAFTLKPSKEPPAQALMRLRVRDAAEPTWPQRTLAAFTPTTGAARAYQQKGGVAGKLTGLTLAGERTTLDALTFAEGGSEQFRIPVPKGSGVVLRKRFLLDQTGQEAEVLVNGKSAGAWNLKRSEEKLSGGLRDAIFVLDAKALAGAAEAAVEVRYKGAANTIGWCALEYVGGALPLSAVGPIHADQNVGHFRLARSMVGTPLKIGQTPFANGIGTFARSLIEYPLSGQFKRFRAKVGVDAITEGRGSVVFEVYADGRKVWASKVVSGLDEPLPIELDVSGVDRLRLIVGDAGDGNQFDAANWCDPVLEK